MKSRRSHGASSANATVEGPQSSNDDNTGRVNQGGRKAKRPRTAAPASPPSMRIDDMDENDSDGGSASDTLYSLARQTHGSARVAIEADIIDLTQESINLLNTASSSDFEAPSVQFIASVERVTGGRKAAAQRNRTPRTPSAPNAPMYSALI
eukprot:Opistho-2@43879